MENFEKHKIPSNHTKYESGAKITPKSTNTLKAQLAAFIDAHEIPDDEDRYGKQYLESNAQDLLDDYPDEVHRSVGEYEYKRDAEGGVYKDEEGRRVLVAAKDQYKEFLKSVGGSSHESIKGRVEILDNYEEFKPAVDELKKEVIELHDPKEHPAFLGNGSNAHVFAIYHNGKKYAARIPTRGGFDKNTSAKKGLGYDEKLKAAIKANKIDRVESLVAVSYEDEVTIAELMSGKDMRHLTSEDLQQVTREQLSKFIDTYLEALQNNINIDPKPSNFFYDIKDGFGIVDVDMQERGRPVNGLGEILGNIKSAITNAGKYGTNRAMTTEREFEEVKHLDIAQVSVLRELQEVVLEKFTQEELREFLEGINSTIKGFEEIIHKYNNPNYVAETIAKNLADEEARKKIPKDDMEGWPFAPFA